MLGAVALLWLTANLHLVWLTCELTLTYVCCTPSLAVAAWPMSVLSTLMALFFSKHALSSFFFPLFFCNILEKCVCVRINIPDHGRDFSIVILLETIIKCDKCQTLLGTVLHPATGSVILLETVNVITVKLS